MKAKPNALNPRLIHVGLTAKCIGTCLLCGGITPQGTNNLAYFPAAPLAKFYSDVDSHERVGRNGKTFKCLKIRSMRSDSQRYLEEYLESNPAARLEWKENHKLTNDPRISPFGNFIRKTSLDEIPQLFNVLKGDMSLVGPRPVTAEEIEKYGSDSEYYLALKPGVTGLWQTSGRNNVSYKERVALDVKYFKTMSFWLDIKLMYKTGFAVIKKEGL